MARRKNQKKKILLINDILRQARGERAALSTKQVCAALEKEDIPCDRRTLADDFEVLSEYINSSDYFDYCLECASCGRNNKYYSVSKKNCARVSFDTEELKNLIMAVNSLRLTDDIQQSDMDALKNKLISAASPVDMERLRQYSEDNYYLLDTIAAKILIDSINSLTFMRGNMSNRIIETIIKLADSDDRYALETEQNNPMYHKQINEGTSLYEIDKVFRAIDNKKKLSFKYFDLDENRNKILRHDGKKYIVEPLTLTPNDGHYYLICYDGTTLSGTRTYRIDKMIDISMADEDISKMALEFRDCIPQLTSQSFRMYSGPLRRVTLEFNNNIIGSVFDKFGSDVKIERIDGEHCRISEDIQISPPFLGWLFQFSKEMRIVSPDDVIEDYKRLCSDVINDRHYGYSDGNDKL